MDWDAFTKLGVRRVLWPITFIMLLEIMFFYSMVTQIDSPWNYFVLIIAIPFGKANSLIFQWLLRSTYADIEKATFVRNTKGKEN